MADDDFPSVKARQAARGYRTITELERLAMCVASQQTRQVRAPTPRHQTPAMHSRAERAERRDAWLLAQFDPTAVADALCPSAEAPFAQLQKERMDEPDSRRHDFTIERYIEFLRSIMEDDSVDEKSKWRTNPGTRMAAARALRDMQLMATTVTAAVQAETGLAPPEEKPEREDPLLKMVGGTA